MRVVISSGHGKHVRGASGYIDEVDEARKVVERTAIVLRQLKVETTTYHDDVSKTQNENLNRIVNFHNSKTRDLDVSVHFNAYTTTSKPMGSEVLYVTQAAIAREVVDAICSAGGLINRGPKKRTDLFFLDATEGPSILIEVLFVDSKADVDIYHEKFDAICVAIAESISGKQLEAAPPAPPAPPRVVEKGDSGDDVEGLQYVLGTLVPDGDFGATTEEWVKGFQAATGVAADGVVGPVTWEEVEDLERRVRAGSTGLDSALKDEIVALAEASSLMQYSWKDRGVAPGGYIPGIALSYASALRCEEETALWDAVKVMSKGLGHDDVDALAWFRKEFEKIGMNVKGGAEAMRATFVLLIGLGMRESSGKYCEGRDMSATNVEADTAEAGLFQTSWNISSAHESIRDIMEEFWINPRGFLETFRGEIVASKSNLSCYGSGDGARYQWLARFAPSFAVMTTAVGCRLRRQHWGPINRKEVELLEEACVLLKNIELII